MDGRWTDGQTGRQTDILPLNLLFIKLLTLTLTHVNSLYNVTSIFEDCERILMSYLVLWTGNSLQLEKRTFWSWPTLMMENPTLPIVSSTGTTYPSAISSIYCVCFLVFYDLFYLGLHHGARHFSRVVLTPSPQSPPSAPPEEHSGFQCLDGRRVHVK